MHPYSEYPLQHERFSRLYVFLCVLFASVLILSNMTLKVFYFPFLPNFAMTSGILTYPITFLITDIVSEVWGEKKARFMIFMAFTMNILMIVFTQCVLYLPAHSSWIAPDNPFGFTSLKDYQTAFSSVFSINGMIFVGSMVAYLIGQLLDIKIFCVLKRKTNGKHLWLRNNVSTLFSQLIDTFIMNGIVLAFGLKLGLWTCLTIIFAEYLYKAIFALLDTPIIYLTVAILKRRYTSYDQVEVV